MVIESTTIRNFRAIDDLTVALEDLTVLLGANSAGKSTLMRALEWFFEGTKLDLDDVRDRDPEAVLSVRVTFNGFRDADRAAFPGYTTGDRMTLLKTRHPDGSVKLTGRGLILPAFREVRALEGAVAIRGAFNAFLEEHPEMGLERAASQDQALSQMEAWEQQHPAQCEEDDLDATHLLGAVGQGILRQRFKFVIVPALRDAAQDAQEGRDSALSRLLMAIAEQRDAAGARVAELEREMRARYEQVVTEAHGTSLDELSEAMTQQLRTLISRAEVRLEAQPGTLTLPGPRVTLRAGEGGSLTDIGRQGHGFQRTFIITALRYLSESVAGADNAPTIFLAIEEPELYQHPVRARHFAAVLERLVQREDGTVQVMYATHSPYFVNARRFASFRVFRRAMGDEDHLLPPGVTSASTDDVAVRLEGIVDRDHISRRLARTIDDNPAFGEAFFGDSVLLTEGFHDVRVLQEVARLTGEPLEADGIVACHVASKTAIAVAHTILSLLDIPAYVVFDGDSNCNEEQREATIKQNRDIQKLIGIDEIVDSPESGAHERFAVFGETMEASLREAIDGFEGKCRAVSERSDWRPKAGETYAMVIAAEPDVPALFREVVRRARATDRG